MTKAKCVHCGKRFTKNTSRHKFCSPNCGDSHRHGYNPRSLSNCAHCGDAFEPRYANLGRKRRFCCDTCRYDNVRGMPVRDPAVRAKAREDYLAGRREQQNKRAEAKQMMPKISKQEIGWADVKNELRSLFASQDSRPKYGYLAGDKAVTSGTPVDW